MNDVDCFMSVLRGLDFVLLFLILKARTLSLTIPPVLCKWPPWDKFDKVIMSFRRENSLKGAESLGFPSSQTLF